MVIAFIAVALFGAGLFALSWPASLDEYDRWGFRIGCGSGLAADYEQATTADQGRASIALASSGQATPAADEYVSQCQSAVWLRRGWAYPLVLVGAGLVIGLLDRWRRDGSAATRSRDELGAATVDTALDASVEQPSLSPSPPTPSLGRRVRLGPMSPPQSRPARNGAVREQMIQRAQSSGTGDGVLHTPSR